MSLEKMVKQMVETMNMHKGTEPYDTTAEVVRVDGDTVWVHIAGGVDETPVKKTINAVKGDRVQIRVGGGTAWIVGNESKPPTDDRVANVAQKTAENADLKAILAKKTADDASKVATNYIDFTEEDGLTVGYKDLESKVNISGGGVKLYDEEGNVGTEIKSGSVRVGKEDETHLEIKANGFELKDYEGEAYAVIEDMRDAQTHIAMYEQNEIYNGDAIKFDFNADELPDISETQVYVNSVLQTSGYQIEEDTSASPSVYYLIFSTHPQTGSRITIKYPTTSADLKRFTFGKRNSGSVGCLSGAFGNDNVASGISSFAQGAECSATGRASHAEGHQSIVDINGFGGHAEGHGTYAPIYEDEENGIYFGGHAEGKYNVKNSPLPIISVVGVGDDDEHRKNGFAVTTDGDTRLKGDVYVGCNNDSTGGRKVTSQAQGEVLTVSGVTAQSYKDYAVTFPTPYASTPLVVAGLAGTLTAYGMGMVSVAVNNVTTTGFTARVYNASSNDRNVTFRYIAIAP